MAAKTLICPGCRTEYRPGFTTCAECGRLLVDATHLAPPRPLGESIQEVVVARDASRPATADRTRQTWSGLPDTQGGRPNRCVPERPRAPRPSRTGTVFGSANMLT